jgi:glycosyltransferase involved in cell wall biosynthesis
LLFPGEEDFGIVPVEAQACGAPVIAYGRGGILDTIRPLGAVSRPTGVLFPEQSVDGLCHAIERFEEESQAFDPTVARWNALRFGRERYERELFGYIDELLNNRVRVRHAA